MFTKLTQNDDSYFINRKSFFTGHSITENYVELAYHFAYKMTFGKSGEHRGYRSGGQYSRKNGELFCNTFQGKLSEYVLFEYLKGAGLSTNIPDTTTWDLGKWDDCDLVCNDKKISVKSAAFFSNLLLLETKDWDKYGAYIPNETNYDFTVLIRLKPDLKAIFKSQRILFSNEVDKTTLSFIISKESFSYDIPGFITNEDLIKIIKSSFILPQNGMLNGTTKMDASNYYLQTGDLRTIDSIVPLLNK